MSDDLGEIRRIVTDTAADLRLHDSKVDSNVARIAESQERVVAAIERIGDATIAIKAVAEQMKANGASKVATPALQLDRRMIAFAMLVLVVAAIAAGGGAELVRSVMEALRK